MLILIIAGGPDKGRIYELFNGQDIVLGREGDQVKLNDRKVSRAHARLWSEGGQWYVEDLGSRHGTYRNHQALEKGSTAKLKDGDYIQIGNTVMVMGRMPAEHAERLTLLGQQPTQPRPWRRSGVLAVSGAAAALAILGASGYLIFQMDLMRGDSSTQTDRLSQLQQALTQAQQDTAQTNRRLEDMLNHREQADRQLLRELGHVSADLQAHGETVTDATASLQGLTDPLLDRLDTIEGSTHSQQLALERIGEMLAHEAQHDNSEAVYALLRELKTEFADQPHGEELIARLSEAIRTNAEETGEAVRRVLAQARDENAQLAASERTEQLVLRVLDEVASLPSSAQIAADLHEVIGDPYAQQQAFMREVLVELRRTGEQIEASVASTLHEDAGRMADALAELNNRPTAEQIARQIRETDLGSAQRTAEMMEAILARIDEQSILANEVAQLRSLIESRPEGSEELIQVAIARIDEQSRNSVQLLHAIADLRESMPAEMSGQLTQVINKLDEQVRSEQITEAMEAAIHRIATARNQETDNAIDAIQHRLNALPSAEQLEDVLESQQQLARLLDEGHARETLGELRAALERLAEVQPDSTDARLNQILAMLQDREEIDLMLAEMHDLMASQPEQAAAMREELLAAIQQAGGDPTDRLLEELLTQVQQRMTSGDTLRLAIREEMAGTVQPHQMALEDAHDIAAHADPSAHPHPTGHPNTTSGGGRLTALERAYREAFETRRPVTVGAGVVDPATGRVSDGRRLDPDVALALGYATWRDWYLTDQHAERMRLQRQALRDRNAAEADSPLDIVTLPGPVEDQNPPRE